MKKDELTLYVERRTEEEVAKTLNSGQKIDMMRDYWYEVKDEIEHYRSFYDEKRLNALVKPPEDDKYKYTDEEWSDKVTSIITKYIEKMAYKDPSVYKQLGLETETLARGSAPIVVIFEKKKGEAIDIVKKYHGGYFFARGQVPTFEAAHMAAYLEECKYSMGYVFVVSDYDPAGEALYNQVKMKLDCFTTDTDIETIWVEYGDDPVNEFISYGLSDNGTNRKWMKEGRTRGVEFNPKKNIDRGILSYLTKSIEKHVDPRIFVDISHRRWRELKFYKLAENDTYYMDLKENMEAIEKKIEWRELRFRQVVALTNTVYWYESNTRYSTFEDPHDNDPMHPRDQEFYHRLLGKSNPHCPEFKRKALSDVREVMDYRMYY